MAAKKKSRKGKSRKARPMKVVSLKSALHMVRTAQRRIAARGFSRRRRNPYESEQELDDSIENPLRHFPKLKGRGRPAKKRKWTMVTRLANNMVAEKTFKATKEEAYHKARKILFGGKKYHGSAVKEIMLDDGR